MKKVISGICCMAVMLLITSNLQAEDNDTALLVDAGLASIEGEPVEDSELLDISGKGATGFIPAQPETLSVILWDEKGNVKTSTQYESTAGTGNIQKVNVRINRN